jgi:hypothetical protein
MRELRRSLQRLRRARLGLAGRLGSAADRTVDLFYGGHLLFGAEFDLPRRFGSACLARACDAIQTDNLLTREKDFVHRLALRSIQFGVTVFRAEKMSRFLWSR